MSYITPMRGLVFDGQAPDRVRFSDRLAIPEPKPGEIRVRVTHATVNGHEFELASHPLVRLVGWLQGGPRKVRTGLEFAGIVDTAGATHRPGERVMGYVDLMSGMRPHADYVTIPEAYIAASPRGLPLAQAAALPMSALTALESLRHVASLRAGQRVLIVGASGGVGVMAVQIARILGALPIAVASAPHHARLTKLGAEKAIDYRETPIAQIEGPFDAILDFSATLWLSQVRHLLNRRGVFIPADPFRNAADILRFRRARWLMVDKGHAAKLQEIAAWVEQGQLESIVNETFALADWRTAVAQSHARGRLGRIVLEFAPDLN